MTRKKSVAETVTIDCRMDAEAQRAILQERDAALTLVHEMSEELMNLRYRLKVLEVRESFVEPEWFYKLVPKK